MEILCLFLGRDELLSKYVLLVVQWFWDEGTARYGCGLQQLVGTSIFYRMKGDRGQQKEMKMFKGI